MFQTTFCNPHRIETHRALELLSDCYAKLTKSQEKHLIIEIERFIRILKSRFFQALIDIQEFYEVTLLDEITTLDSLTDCSQVSQNTWKSKREVGIFSSFFGSCIIHQNPNLEDSWVYLDIVIERGLNGLGFSIAGGTDNPHIPNDPHIYVTKIIPGGAAAIDGRLEIDDAILYVNDMNIDDVTHATAVSALKQAGGTVKLNVRRRTHEKNIREIELMRNRDGFGFSIAGGVANQHVPGDNSIYITKILDGGSAQADGRLRVGNKLIAVKNSSGYRDLVGATHEQAVELLKTTDNKITLFIVGTKDHGSDQKLDTEEILFRRDGNIDSGLNSKDSLEPLVNTSLTIIESESNFCPDPEGLDKHTRTLTLRKGPHGLGFNIVGGEDGECIFVSFILEGGPASIDGGLRKGDKILSVNESDFINITHGEAARILKDTEEMVTLVVEHNIEEYIRFESRLDRLKNYRTQQPFNLSSILRTTEKKSMFVRALFNYDPNNDEDLPSLGLSFNFGEILNVTNASDDEWWLAKKVFPDHNGSFGIIPACKRWERKQRARERSVKFQGHHAVQLNKQSNLDRRKKNYTFSRKFPFMKNRDDKPDDSTEQEPFMLCYTEENEKNKDFESKEILYRVELPFMEELTLVYLEKDVDDKENQQLCGEENILSYEEVEQVDIEYARPIVILGPMKDQINDDLITLLPEEFDSCVPHTTRPKRDQEIDGKDYHFVTSREQMEQDIRNHLFIEAGQYNENLYGTSIASIKEVAEKGKHCILDVSGNAIKRLYAASLYPITLFIKMKTPEAIRHLNKNMTEEQVRKIYHRAFQIEQEYAENFTEIIEGDNYEDLYERIRIIIKKHSSQRIWIPCKYKKI